MVRLKPSNAPFQYPFGKRGETLASDFLVKQGFKVLERNFRCPIGEIDIIAENNHCLHFIEVKTRSSHAYGRPEESVHEAKQRKLFQLALWYLKKHRRSEGPLSFDVIAVTSRTSQAPEIQHLQHAFEWEEAFEYDR